MDLNVPHQGMVQHGRSGNVPMQPTSQPAVSSPMSLQQSPVNSIGQSQPISGLITRPSGPVSSPPSVTMNSQMSNIRPPLVDLQTQVPIQALQQPPQMLQQMMPNAAQIPITGQQLPVSGNQIGPQSPAQAVLPTSQSTPMPHGSHLTQKNTRVTTVPKPVGINPLIILQERENRQVFFCIFYKSYKYENCIMYFNRCE